MFYVSSRNGVRIYSFNNGQFKFEKVLLPNEVCSSIEFDDLGGLWVSTLTNGIFHLPKQVSEKLLINQVEVTSFKNTENGFFLFTKDQRFYRKKNKDFQLIADLKSFMKPDQVVWEILESKKDWILYSNKGIIYIDKNTIKPRTILFNSGAHRIGIVPKGTNTHYGSSSYGLTRILEDSVQMISDEKSKFFRVYQFAEKEGKIFLAAGTGLFQIENNTLIQAYPEYFSGKRINSIQILDGIIYVGTSQYGLYIIDKGRVRNFKSKDGLLSNQIDLMCPASEGGIWVKSSNGIQHFKYVSKTIIEIKKLDIKTTTKGIVDSYSMTEVDNVIYLSSQYVVTYYDLSKSIPNASLRLVRDESLMDGVRIEMDQNKMVFPNDVGEVRFRFSGLNFTKHPTIFHYKINDGDWTKNESGEIVLSSLGPGKYDLKVYASSNFYANSPLKSISFSVKRPFWSSIWFYILASILVIALISFFIGWRLNLRLNHKRRLMTMELQALQSQMNPHFTFNTMNSIQNFILKNDIRSSIDYLSQFSKLMRMILEQARLQVIPLSEEISFLTLYVKLERLRLQNSFELEFEVDDSIQQTIQGIPSMLLQPFVENAIWHGLADIDYPGLLKIKFTLKEDSLCCQIIDNGRGRTKAQKFKRKAKGHKSRGVAITSDRMRIFQELYGKKINFSIEDAPEGQDGTTVKITLPILKVKTKKDDAIA